MASYPRERRKTSGLRARAWWVLRKNRQMTLAQIQQSICTGSEKNAETNLRTWLNRLVSAGVMTRELIDDGKLTSNGSYVYRLKQDLGPLCPVVQLEHERVYDPNGRMSFPLPKTRPVKEGAYV